MGELRTRVPVDQRLHLTDVGDHLQRSSRFEYEVRGEVVLDARRRQLLLHVPRRSGGLRHLHPWLGRCQLHPNWRRNLADGAAVVVMAGANGTPSKRRGSRSVLGELGGRVAGAAGPNGPGGRRSDPDLGHGFGPRPDATGEPATPSGQRRGAAGAGSWLGSTSYSPCAVLAPGVRGDRIDFRVGVARLEPPRLTRTYRALARRQPVDTE